MKQLTASAVILAFVLSLTPLTSGAARQDQVNARANDFAAIKKEEVETKKAELKQRIEARKQERQIKLTDQRLETCKKREVAVNQVIAKRVAADRKNLTAFDTVRTNLEKFIERKQLDVTPQTELKNAMDTNREVAEESIDALRAQTFSCDVTDANNPGGVVKEVDSAARESLKAYRTSIRVYAQAVKKIAEVAAPSAPSEETTSDGEGVQ